MMYVDNKMQNDTGIKGIQCKSEFSIIGVSLSES